MASTVDQVTQRRRGVGLIAHDPALSAGGYTLIAPQTADGHVYLVDIEGRVAHEWKLPVRAGRHAVILPNGNLGYNGNHPRSPDRYAPWSMWHGGDFYEVTPQGEIVWRHEDPDHHHDGCPTATCSMPPARPCPRALPSACPAAPRTEPAR